MWMVPGANEYLSLSDLCKLWGVKPSWVYRRTAAGHHDPLPAFNLGGKLRFKREEIDAWLEEHRVQHGEEWKPEWE